MKTLTAAFAALLLLSAPAFADDPAKHGHAKVGNLKIMTPWARASAGMARAGAAFMTIQNAGATADRLVAAETSVAKRPELHTHIREGDVMRMRQVKAIDVPASGKAELKPGGLHVMLIGLNEPLKEGQTFQLTLTFENAGKVTFDVPIKGVGARSGGMRHGHGGHGNMKGKMKDGMKHEMKKDMKH